MPRLGAPTAVLLMMLVTLSLGPVTPAAGQTDGDDDLSFTDLDSNSSTGGTNATTLEPATTSEPTDPHASHSEKSYEAAWIVGTTGAGFGAVVFFVCRIFLRDVTLSKWPGCVGLCSLGFGVPFLCGFYFGVVVPEQAWIDHEQDRMDRSQHTSCYVINRTVLEYHCPRQERGKERVIMDLCWNIDVHFRNLIDGRDRADVYHCGAKEIECATRWRWTPNGSFRRCWHDPQKDATDFQPVETPSTGWRDGGWAGVSFGIAFIFCGCTAVCYAVARPALAARRQRRLDDAFGRAHPLELTTLGGQQYQLVGWGAARSLDDVIGKEHPELLRGSTGFRLLAPGTGAVIEPERGTKSRTKLLTGVLPLQVLLVFELEQQRAPTKRAVSIEPMPVLLLGDQVMLQVTEYTSV